MSNNWENAHLAGVAGKYAAAMIELGSDLNMLEVFRADLFLIKKTIESSSELNDLIHHPLVKNYEKKEILEKIFTGAVSQYTINLIKILAERNRLLIMPFLADHYETRLCEKINVCTAEVTTAILIDENIVRRIREKLEQVFKRQFKIETKTDEKIIAGMIVRIGDRVIDGSIKTKLDNMKKQLC